MFTSSREAAGFVEGSGGEAVAVVSNEGLAGPQLNCDAHGVVNHGSRKPEAPVIGVATGWFDLDDSVSGIKPERCERSDRVRRIDGDYVQAWVIERTTTKRCVGIDAEFVTRERFSERVYTL